MSEPLGATTVNVQRRAPGAVANFVVVPGATSTFTIRASVQPLNGREFYRLPEGLRSRATFKLYSVDTLYTVRAGSTQPPDLVQVELDGDWFEVHGIEAHGNCAPLPHKKYLLAAPEVK